MSDIYEQIEAQWEDLAGQDNRGLETYENLKPQLPLLFAGTKIILDQAHDVVPYYARSLNNPEYYDIERDEWKIGHDWNFTDNNGICFFAGVNVGQYRDPWYKEYYIVLPWHILESYIKDPENTKATLIANYSSNVLKVQQADEKAAAETKIRQDRAREELDRKQYELLKQKFEST